MGKPQAWRIQKFRYSKDVQKISWRTAEEKGIRGQAEKSTTQSTVGGPQGDLHPKDHNIAFSAAKNLEKKKKTSAKNDQKAKGKRVELEVPSQYGQGCKSDKKKIYYSYTNNPKILPVNDLKKPEGREISSLRRGG